MRRLRLTFSVRAMLLAILLVGLLIGPPINRARRQREAVSAIKKYGGWVNYDHEFVHGKFKVWRRNELWTPVWGEYVPGRKPWAPSWLRWILGDEYFQDIAYVILNVDASFRKGYGAPPGMGPSDGILAKFAGQSSIKTLQIGGQQTTDRGLSYVRGMTGLQELIIYLAPRITDAGVAHLKGLANLKVVFITDSGITNEGLRHLGGLPNVEHLILYGNRLSDKGLAHLKEATRLKTLSIGGDQTNITDAGLAHLEGLSELEILDLRGSKVTDRGLEHLKGLRKLKELWVGQTSITEEGKKRIRELIPGVQVKKSP